MKNVNIKPTRTDCPAAKRIEETRDGRYSLILPQERESWTDCVPISKTPPIPKEERPTNRPRAK